MEYIALCQMLYNSLWKLLNWFDFNLRSFAASLKSYQSSSFGIENVSRKFHNTKICNLVSAMVNEVLFIFIFTTFALKSVVQRNDNLHHSLIIPVHSFSHHWMLESQLLTPICIQDERNLLAQDELELTNRPNDANCSRSRHSSRVTCLLSAIIICRKTTEKPWNVNPLEDYSGFIPNLIVQKEGRKQSEKLVDC